MKRSNSSENISIKRRKEIDTANALLSIATSKNIYPSFPFVPVLRSNSVCNINKYFNDLIHVLQSNKIIQGYQINKITFFHYKLSILEKDIINDVNNYVYHNAYKNIEKCILIIFGYTTDTKRWWLRVFHDRDRIFLHDKVLFIPESELYFMPIPEIIYKL
jgi:hypothetical protein